MAGHPLVPLGVSPAPSRLDFLWHGVAFVNAAFAFGPPCGMHGAGVTAPLLRRGQRLRDPEPGQRSFTPWMEGTSSPRCQYCTLVSSGQSRSLKPW